MDILLNHFNNNIISLGSNCHVKLLFKNYIDTPTLFFDWIGTSLWFINHFFFTDTNFFYPQDFKLIKIFNKYHNESVYTNTKYYIRFQHDINNIEDIIITKIKYEKRKNRFIQTLNDSNYILFVRIEELFIQNRNFPPNIKKYYHKNELQYLQEFNNIINDKFTHLKFKILLFSFTINTSIIDNILIIKLPIITNYHSFQPTLKKYIKKNKHIIKQFIQN